MATPICPPSLSNVATRTPSAGRPYRFRRGGYDIADAREFVDSHARGGWLNGQAPTWAIEAPRGGQNQFCGSISLQLDDPRTSLGWVDPPVLTGAEVVLRPFDEADAPRIVQACSDPRTRQWLASLPSPYGLAEARDFLEATRETAAQRTGLNWCVADRSSGVCLGSISLVGFGGHSRRAEIGYWAHPGARGAGVTTAAVRLVTQHAEANPQVDSIVIRCAAGNAASRHLAEAAGYRIAGVLPASEPLGDASVADLVTYSRP